MAEKEIGRVTHYYDKIGVVVVKLSDNRSTGDAIKVSKGEDEFTDVVGSMQINQEPVSSAKAGQEVAIMLSKPAKQGARIFKVE